MPLRNKVVYSVCYGISSFCQDGQHILMMDFDKIHSNTLLSIAQTLQNSFNLSDMYIIKSTHGYNLLSLDKITLNLLYQIGMTTKYTDKNFFKYGFNRHYYVLRFDNDKTIKTILTNNSKKYRKSLAHAIFLNDYMNTGILIDDTFDHNTKLDIIQYPSNKNGYHVVERLK